MKRVVFLVSLLFIGCGSSDNSNKTDKLTLDVNTTWQWQLQGAINTSYDVKVYDIDLFDTNESLINELHNQGKIVICYFSAGSWEEWRSDADSFSDEVKGNDLDGWEGEKWLDISNLTALAPIMKNRLDLAKAKGCDGVEPDNVDGYINDTGFNLSYQDQLNYNKFLADEAHKRGLLIALKNDLEQIQDLEPYFDFAINEQCDYYNECSYYTPFIQNNKAVFNAEYAQIYVDNNSQRDNLCLQARNEGIRTLVLPLELDDSFRYSCD